MAAAEFIWCGHGTAVGLISVNDRVRLHYLVYLVLRV